MVEGSVMMREAGIDRDTELSTCRERFGAVRERTTWRNDHCDNQGKRRVLVLHGHLSRKERIELNFICRVCRKSVLGDDAENLVRAADVKGPDEEGQIGEGSAKCGSHKRAAGVEEQCD